MIDLVKKTDAGEKPGAMTEIAPGIFRVVNVADLGKTCLAKWRRNADGSHSLVPIIGRRVVVSARLLERLGLDGCKITLRRLATAGFIDMRLIAPRVTLLNLDSLVEHEQRVSLVERKGSSFWTGDNLRRYQQALAMEADFETDQQSLQALGRGRSRGKVEK